MACTTCQPRVAHFGTVNETDQEIVVVEDGELLDEGVFLDDDGEESGDDFVEELTTSETAGVVVWTLTPVICLSTAAIVAKRYSSVSGGILAGFVSLFAANFLARILVNR